MSFNVPVSTGTAGFKAVTDLYFHGDTAAHKQWFADYGFFVYVRNSRPWEFFGSGKFAHWRPKPHPAWTAEQSAICEGCRFPNRDCLCDYVPF